MRVITSPGKRVAEVDKEYKQEVPLYTILLPHQQYQINPSTIITQCDTITYHYLPWSSSYTVQCTSGA